MGHLDFTKKDAISTLQASLQSPPPLRTWSPQSASQRQVTTPPALIQPMTGFQWPEFDRLKAAILLRTW